MHATTRNKSAGAICARRRSEPFLAESPDASPPDDDARGADILGYGQASEPAARGLVRENEATAPCLVACAISVAWKRAVAGTGLTVALGATRPFLLRSTRCRPDRGWS